MDIMKHKWRKNLLHKAWDRYRSFSLGSNKSSRSIRPSLTKSKSWSTTTTRSTNFIDPPYQDCEETNTTTTTAATTTSNKTKRNKKNREVAPHGCFAVLVGPEKQRFVLKAKSANHPLFRMLLEDAEMEYGFASQGPILLPCEVDMFYKVLAEMENSGDDDVITSNLHLPSWSPLFLCSPSRKSTSPLTGNCKGYGAYRLLSPSRSMLHSNGV